MPCQSYYNTAGNLSPIPPIATTVIQVNLWRSFESKCKMQECLKLHWQAEMIQLIVKKEERKLYRFKNVQLQ
jgi:hypothetical protein